MTTIKANFHTHTTYCDGHNEPEKMVERALELGFTTLGFSGHMDADIHMDTQKYYQEIRRLQEKYASRIEILRGIELDTLYDPSCTYDAEYWIGSTHFLDVPSPRPMAVDADWEQFKEACETYFGGDYFALCRSYYELEASVYDRTKCTFVGHFDLVTRFNDQIHYVDEDDPRYYLPAMEAMEHLVKQGLPFEINCGAVNLKRKADFYPSRRLLTFLHQIGGEILINSDAHHKEYLNGSFDKAVEVALACGFDHTNVLTREGGKLVWHQVALI